MNIKSYLLSLRQRNFFAVSSALLVKSVTSLMLGVVLPKLLSTENYGIYTYVLTIVGLILPFSGGGLNHSMLYFGSLRGTDKNSLLNSFKSTGFTINLFLYLLTVSVASFFVLDYDNGFLTLLALSLSLFAFFSFNLSNTYLRVNENNQKYARSLYMYSGLQLLILPLVAYMNNVVALALAYSLIPLIVVRFYRPKIAVQLKSKLISIKDHLRYGVNVGLGSIVSEFLLRSDIILIGIMIGSPEIIATYKVATIIPMGLMILPRAILTTDFVHIAKNGVSRSFILDYYKNYIKMALPISVIIFLLLKLYSSNLVEIIWGKEYSNSAQYLKILSIGILPTFLLRNPLGYIYNAIGKAKFNVKLSVVMIFVNVSLSWVAIKLSGPSGAAYATVITYLIGGVISLYYLLSSNFDVKDTSMNQV